MYEMAYVENGKLVRGGIKAPLQTAEEWLREREENEPTREWAIVTASPNAVTREELISKLTEMFERRNEK